MEPIHFTLIAATLVGGCSIVTPSAIQVPDVGMPITLAYSQYTNAQTYAGHYYRGNYTGYNLDLILKADGTYTGTWRGCGGVYGTAKGFWSADGKQILLKSVVETGMMKGHLRALDIRQQKEKISLLPVEDRAKNQKDVAREHMYFQKQK